MLFALCTAGLWAQSSSSVGPGTRAEAPASAASPSKEGDSNPNLPSSPGLEARTQLNLLGQTDANRGESRRNENIQFNLIDNNALKEINQRLGVTPTIIAEFQPERNYYGSEFGTAPSSSILLPSRPVAPGWHGQLQWMHLNSIFSARAFFQVGPVQPARENSVSIGATGPVWPRARLSLDGSRQLIRGIVNGNVQVPAPDERTPLASDPRVRAFVQRILDAFPAELPNRTDIDPRMLNTNAPQRVQNDHATLRLDQELNGRDSLTASYTHIAARVQAFQLIKGQNPDTTTMSHQAGWQWRRAWSARTQTVAALRFDRTRSLITLENNAIGYQIFTSGLLRAISDNNAVPIDRAQNHWRPAFQVSHQVNNWSWKAGFELLRRQMNGRESDAHIPALAFFNNYGNTTITNLRLGLPSTLWIAQGDLHRGYRNWDNWFYAAAKWAARSRLTLNLILGYRPISHPVEVNGLDRLPYYSDNNNFGPALGLAYRLPRSFGVWRMGYGLHYGEVFPVTFQQVRFNPPHNYKAVIQDPDLLRLVNGGYNIRANPPRQSVFYDYQPNLVSPYSQQYHAVWELAPAPAWTWQLAYVGSRSIKVLNHWYLNRAHPRPGIPLTTATVDARRAISSMGEIRRVMNSSRGYFDAFRTTVSSRNYRGVTLEASYWLSKAIDLGGDYTNTAHDVDSFRYRSQGEFDVVGDLRSVSRFDSPHAFLLKADYRLPEVLVRRLPGWFGRWQVDSVTLLKTGTPFNLTTGSDAPGFGNVDGISGDRPHVVDPRVLGRTISHPDRSREQLPKSAFAFIEPGQPRGNLGRHVFRRASIRNWNAGFTGQWGLPRDWKVTFRAESINLTNTPQFAEPGFTLTDPNFGVITNTLNDGRSFRFSLRLSR
ncbi:MAG: hypothetical protein NZV14_06725 [Bryobacteraceae bacterium]|nr:hypothetical protein [Bryobacteraceae bacterium]MDW8377836.1 hypothetical protein [Bryobacterales bacterium]